ncbi:MAG TPA: helix-turn-helix domain-containing protein [Caulobacteraceae bacterium]|nr:helix-turn-helix domain-containing protein [Caulobacteraceae bacterium]
MRRPDTAAALQAIARTEFLRYGFDGTDVSRIARRAGVSPNTFYRCFKGKVDIFIAVYLAWAAEEQKAFERLLGKPAPVAELVDAVVARQRQHLWFRRSVRRLAHEDSFVRRAVALVRHEQLRALMRWASAAADPSAIATDLAQFEHLAVLLAEGELSDMALDESAARDRLVAFLMRWRLRPAPALEGPAISA